MLSCTLGKAKSVAREGVKAKGAASQLGGKMFQIIN